MNKDSQTNTTAIDANTKLLPVVVETWRGKFQVVNRNHLKIDDYIEFKTGGSHPNSPDSKPDYGKVKRLEYDFVVTDRGSVNKMQILRVLQKYNGQ